jgi:chorismate synthase
VVELIIRGVPAGVGEPVFDRLDATLSHALMSIGAIKGIEFGAGFEVARMLGSECNDESYVDPETGRVAFYTNNAGGILGGISNGSEIRIRLAVKPTPTVSVAQRAVDVDKMEDGILQPITRRDATLLSRIYPVCEAMARIAILDAIMCANAYRSVTQIDPKWDKI